MWVVSYQGGSKVMPLKVLSWKAPFLSTQLSFPPQLIDSKHPDSPNMMKEGKMAHVWLLGWTIAQEHAMG